MGKPAEATVAQSPTATIPENPGKDTVYKNDTLGIVFQYPSDLVPADAKAIADRGHRAIYGNDPESDPEHVKSEKCMIPLLVAETPESNGPTTGTFTIGEKGKPYVNIELPPSGLIMLTEMDRSCLPKKMSTNDALGNMASTAQKLPGMKPIDQQMWYDVDKHKVHFSASYGQISPQRLGGKKVQAEDSAVATISVEVNGHLLLWMIMANSEDLFNKLLASKVQFGSGPVLPLFPLTVGNGPPVKLVP
ncbi:MAG: hypothetical protein ABSG84_05970 [Acidobacteriaceae bacterium]